MQGFASNVSWETVGQMFDKRMDAEERREERTEQIVDNPEISDETKKMFVLSSEFGKTARTGIVAGAACFVTKCAGQTIMVYAKEMTKQAVCKSAGELAGAAIKKVAVAAPKLLLEALIK